MKQILILLVFMACALIESPEDYVCMDRDRSVEVVVENQLDQEVDSDYKAEFRSQGEHDHTGAGLRESENLVYSF